MPGDEPGIFYVIAYLWRINRKALARLFVDDLRYTMQDGQESPLFAALLSKAMIHFANTPL
ncbi:hypothetical protein [Tellurirhabdus bombi]|uniref:hypothetical protein n=1 Tax=Tellurirhabdus bombi TaxID=2907205 RepID=UPI001F1600E5|nr:hypothetical protein [Tellurirhabdus bombi]